MEGFITLELDSINIPGFLFLAIPLCSRLPSWSQGQRKAGPGALGEVLQGLADSHTGPVEGPSQGDHHQKQQHGPGGVDPRVGLSLQPRSSLEGQRQAAGQNIWIFSMGGTLLQWWAVGGGCLFCPAALAPPTLWAQLSPRPTE